jgi:triphosphatase
MALNNREFELKLELSSDDLDRLEDNLFRWAGQGSTQELKSVYYDTPDNHLRAENISLRVRSDGDGFVQTVKLETNLKNGVSNPIEIEDDQDGPDPDPERIGDADARERVLDAIDGSALMQATVVTRSTHRIERQGTAIELSLDKGEARAFWGLSGVLYAIEPSGKRSRLMTIGATH